ncbi:MAG: DUF7065 domain-containing protein [Candidatus Methanomethylicaceae archaeon]
MNIPEIQDDYIHIHSRDSSWRESYYFNFVDATNKVSGFSTIGLLPNANRREFVLALFHEEEQKIHFREVPGPFQADLSSLSDGALSYILVEPFKEWKIIFKDTDISANIRWKARFPPYMFGSGSRTSWSEHFEQSGLVEGEITLNEGIKIQITGFGERDKSWGERNWHIDEWFALHAQFKTLSIGLRRDIVGGKTYVSGGVSSKKRCVPISHVDVEVGYIDKEIRIPALAKTVIRDLEGRVFTLYSSLISSNSFARFTRRFPGGMTELFEDMVFHECPELGETGTGLAEWLFTRRD